MILIIFLLPFVQFFTTKLKKMPISVYICQTKRKTMRKIVVFLALPLLFVAGFANNKAVMPNKNKEMNAFEYIHERQFNTFHNLSKEDKAEFIKHVIETGDCEWKGIKLYGKVQFVTSFPDIKIQYVTSFPDIKVEFVSSFPDKCGKWQEVTSFPDFKVQVVTSFPDIKVQKVTSFPGMN